MSSEGSDETAEIAAKLITIATEPRLNALHSIASSHLGVTKAQMDIDFYASDRWTAEASELLKSAFAQPNNSNFTQYDLIVWKGLLSVWAGDNKPQKAVDIVVANLKNSLGNKIIITK